jgi:hypothetical protein
MVPSEVVSKIGLDWIGLDRIGPDWIKGKIPYDAVLN